MRIERHGITLAVAMMVFQWLLGCSSANSSEPPAKKDEPAPQQVLITNVIPNVLYADVYLNADGSLVDLQGMTRTGESLKSYIAKTGNEKIGLAVLLHPQGGDKLPFDVVLSAIETIKSAAGKKNKLTIYVSDKRHK